MRRKPKIDQNRAKIRKSDFCTALAQWHDLQRGGRIILMSADGNGRTKSRRSGSVPRQRAVARDLFD
jgi:hypothetical protein